MHETTHTGVQTRINDGGRRRDGRRDRPTSLCRSGRHKSGPCDLPPETPATNYSLRRCTLEQRDVEPNLWRQRRARRHCFASDQGREESRCGDPRGGFHFGTAKRHYACLPCVIGCWRQQQQKRRTPFRKQTSAPLCRLVKPQCRRNAIAPRRGRSARAAGGSGDGSGEGCCCASGRCGGNALASAPRLHSGRFTGPQKAGRHRWLLAWNEPSDVTGSAPRAIRGGQRTALRLPLRRTALCRVSSRF